MSAQKKIEMNVYCVENEPSFELDYFDVKQAVDEAHRLKQETQGAIKAMRVFYNGKMVLECTINKNFQAWKEAERKARILSERYIEQCKRPKY